MSANPQMTSEQLEIQISLACAQLAHATDSRTQRLLFRRIQQLHDQRSPEQVARMEKAAGLIR